MLRLPPRLGFIANPFKYSRRLSRWNPVGSALNNTLKGYSTTGTNYISLPEHLAHSFSFWPSFLSLSEQRTLLLASLNRLDALDPVPLRRKRAKLFSKEVKADPDDLQSIFAPDELYEFHEGHYDGVIHHYREMHLSSWPDMPGLPEITERLLSICPSQEVQTHLLHLASYGDILPHVDNADASGSWILGVSLGDERVLRMETSRDNVQSEMYELSLPSGSVYLQQDTVRYNYKHAILRKAQPQGTSLPAGQRLSVMFRDLPRNVRV